MIKRWILHVEVHRGYRPVVSFRRVPQHGDRVVDGGQPGMLVRCPVCSDGFMHIADTWDKPGQAPQPSS